MYARILVAIDGSQVATRALEQALALAKALGSAVTIVHVAEVAPRVGEDHGAVVTATQNRVALLVEATQAATDKLLDEAQDACDAAGVGATTMWIENSSPAEGIVETAESVGAELIVMGTNGRRGLTRMILGSQTISVLQNTKVPVLVTR